MTFKQKIYSHCLQVLNNKIQELENTLAELSESASNNTKSSAGDKHETGRAMIQIEQETIGKQLKETQDQRMLLEKIEISSTPPQITKGSLVKTNKGYLFLSIALGKIIVDEKTVMVISPQSPLGIKLMGSKTNDIIMINGINYIIECIC